jgi:hypothetical protein
MMRNLVALAALSLAGMFLLPEPAVAAGGGRGALPAFRAPVFAPRVGRVFRPVHRPSALPRAVYAAKPLPPLGPRHVRFPPSPHGFATTTPIRPFGHLARRHHRAYHQGWDFPLTVDAGAGYGYIGTPYDPTEIIPVYGPAPAVYDYEVEPAAAPPRASAVRDENAEACRSERVTVPAAGGEREITVVRC